MGWLTAVLPLLMLAALSPGLASPARPLHATRATDVDTTRRLDINELTMFVANDGILGFDRTELGGGLFFPRGASTSVLFASGLWIGARVAGDLRLTTAYYGSEFSPGAMPGGIGDDPAKPEYRVWKVARWTGSPSDTAHVERSSAELAADPMLDPLLHHGWSEYLANAVPHGAPVRAWQLPVAGGGTVSVPGPDVSGDLLLWSVFNDADATRHDQQPGSTSPLGIEVRQSVFAYAGTGPTGKMTFVRWRIVNRGAQTLDSLRVAMWLDSDLGGFTDDFVGCDTTRSMGFTYNALASDASYLWKPPAFGVDLLDESLDATRGRSLGVDAYAGFSKGRDPVTAADAWALMSGAPWEFRPPEAGPFDLTGDPVTNSGDLDQFPSDRRMLLARHHGTLAPGDSLDVTLVLVVGQGANRLDSVTQLRCLDDQAQSVRDSNFPYPPPAPVACPAGPLECPRTPGWFAAACDGSGELRAGQLDSLALALDQQSVTFAWGALARRDSLCGVFGDEHDARAQAKREYAALLANATGANTLMKTSGSGAIRLDPGMPVSCSALPARTVGEMVAPAPIARVLAADYVNEDQTHRRALEGIDWGGEGFGGGAGFGYTFFGGTIDPAIVSADSFPSIQFRFDGTQKAYRFLRLERASDGSAPPQGRAYLYRGYASVQFQCRDVTGNQQFEAAFVERCLTADDGTILPVEQQPATFDKRWAPDFTGDGGHEYLFALSRAYAGVEKGEIGYDGSIADGSQPLLYALWSRRRSNFDAIDPSDRFDFRYELPPSPGADARLLALEGRPLSDPAVEAEYASIRDCLASLNRGDWLNEPCDAAAPLPPSLVSAVADFQHVSLTWQMPPGELEHLERFSPTDDFWVHVGTIPVGPSGLVEYRDTDIRPGQRYGYRLGPSAGSAPPYVESFVNVPLPSSLALSTMFPNPGGTQRTVRFTLRSHEHATLEILDIAGRSHVKREVSALGPGSHVITITDRLPPGIYLLRLQQGGEEANSKAVVIR
jgi:hypothetical protein